MSNENTSPSVRGAMQSYLLLKEITWQFVKQKLNAFTLPIQMYIFKQKQDYDFVNTKDGIFILK